MKAAMALLLAATAAPLAAQSTAERTEEQMRASYDAHIGDFDYLLGDWEFTTVHREYGAGHGVWSAVRLAEGQILDEYRLLGPEGETWYVTTTLRAYNAALDRWELVGMDTGGGLQDTGTARRMGDEVHIEQTFGASSPDPVRVRIRYYDIRPDGFSWTASRLLADGTWEPDYITIEARRIGPARTLGPLAVARTP